MLKLQDLIISSESLGSKLWLIDIIPAYEYRDNRRTDTITGYKYIVALPEKGLEKISIRIDGKQQLEKPESGFVEARFDNLEVFIYWLNGTPNVAARATKISLVNNKA